MLNIRLEGKLPIYEQLYNGISRLISSGELEPDERLPAVREVAKQFGINPNTVQKSYSQLEQAGLILLDTCKGKLCFRRRGRSRGSQKRSRAEGRA